MAAALPFLMIASTAMSVIGTLNQASAAADSARYNAQMAEQNAQAARQQGAAAQAAQSRKAEKHLGSMAAAFSASGVSMEGSALDLMGESAGQAELDRQMIGYNTELRALGHMNTATLDRQRASSAETGGYLKAGSELLRGAAGYAYMSSGTSGGYESPTEFYGMRRTG